VVLLKESVCDCTHFLLFNGQELTKTTTYKVLNLKKCDNQSGELLRFDVTVGQLLKWLDQDKYLDFMRNLRKEEHLFCCKKHLPEEMYGYF